MAPVGKLKMFCDPSPNLTPWDPEPGEWNEISPTTDVFKEVARFIDLALCILESTDGRRRLIDCGNRAVDGWDRRRLPHNFQNYRKSMSFCVDFFLHKIRRRFPDIYITKTLDVEASIRTATWGSRLEDYDPKVAALFKFNMTIIEHLVFAAFMGPYYRRAGNVPAARTAEDEYEGFHLQKVLAADDALVIAFVDFLSGRDFPDPPLVAEEVDLGTHS